MDSILGEQLLCEREVGNGSIDLLTPINLWWIDVQLLEE